MCMAHAAPGSRFFPSVGSGAACRLAPRPVAHPPTRQGAGSLGLAGRGVRWPHHCHTGRWRPVFCALAIAATSTAPTSRGVCPAAQSPARLRWGAPLHCAPRQGAYIMAHPPGARWGLSPCGRSGHRRRTPARALAVVLGCASPPLPPHPGGFLALRPSFSVLRTVLEFEHAAVSASFAAAKFCHSSFYNNFKLSSNNRGTFYKEKEAKRKGGCSFRPPRPLIN